MRIKDLFENKNPGYKAGEPYWEQKPQEKAYVVYDSDGNEIDRFEYQHVWDSSPAMNKATEKLRALRVDYHSKKKAEQYAIDQAKPLRDLEKRYLDMLSSIKRYERYIYPKTKEDDILDTETKELYMQTVIKWYKELERISPAVRPSIIDGTYKPQN